MMLTIQRNDDVKPIPNSFDEMPGNLDVVHDMAYADNERGTKNSLNISPATEADDY
jgi:hypothetical protein